MLDPAWKTSEPNYPGIVEFERTVYAAVTVGTVAFGIHAAIYSICSYHLLKVARKKTPLFQLAYVTLLFLLAGITIGCNIGHNQLTWIDYRGYPGGPAAFIQEQQGHVANTIGNSAGNAVAFFVDCILIYRCFVVWNNNYFVIVLPILMLIASTALGILQTIAASRPNSALWNERAVQFGLPYFCLSMTTNMLVTVIITTRLLLARKQIRQVMGDQHGKEYTGIASMLVESAAPPALISLVLIVLYARAIPEQVLFYPLLPQVQAIAPQLIFIRVTRGRAWNKNTLSGHQTSTGVRFGSNPSDTLASSKPSHLPWGDKSSSININQGGSEERIHDNGHLKV